MSVEDLSSLQLETIQQEQKETPKRGRPKTPDINLDRLSRGGYEWLDPKTGEWLNPRMIDRDRFEALVKNFIVLVDPALPLLWRCILMQEAANDPQFKHREIAYALTEDQENELDKRENRLITKIIQVPNDQEYEIIVRPKNPLNAFCDILMQEPVEDDEGINVE